MVDKLIFLILSKRDVVFLSTTKEKIFAATGFAGDSVIPTIVFHGERSRHGNVCQGCWGYRINCVRTLIVQYTEDLDKFMSLSV